MAQARIIASFDPLVDLGAVVTNGRYVFGHQFVRAVLDHADIDAWLVIGDPEEAVATAEEAGYGQHIGQRLRFAPWDLAPEILADPSIMAVHTGLSKALVAPAVEMRRLIAGQGPPATATVHGLAYPSQMPTLLGVLCSDLRPGDAVVCPSPTAHHHLRAMLESLWHGLEGRRPIGIPGAAPPPLPLDLPIVPHGVDTERFRPRPQAEARRALELPESEPLVLSIGRVDAINKMDLRPTLRLLGGLAERARATGQPPPRLVLVATQASAESRRLELLARQLGVPLTVVFDPPPERLCLYYNACDLTLVLSDTISEMFGLTALEAMASGAAIIATEVGGLRDLFVHQRNAWLVPTATAGDLPRAMALGLMFEDATTLARMNAGTVVALDQLTLGVETLLADPALRARLGAAARREVVTRFAWSTVIGAYVEVWRSARARATREPRPPPGVSLALPVAAALTPMLTRRCDAATRFRVVGGLDVFQAAIEPFIHPQIAAALRLELVPWLLSQAAPFSVDALGAPPVPASPEAVLLVLLWCAKQGLLELA
jgi:glycosyltransferase involved in cell wall biosynthesis